MQVAESWCIRLVCLWVVQTLLMGAPESPDLTAEALRSFPAQITSIEFDDISVHRSFLIHKRSSGLRQEEALAALAQLNINERQITQIAIASDSTSFYELLRGTFSGNAVTESNQHRPFVIHLQNRQAFCSGTAHCILFLKDSLAAFGSLTSLDQMLDVRRGLLKPLADNRQVVSILHALSANTALQGVLVGDQAIDSAVSETFPHWKEWRALWPRVSGQIRAVGYSVDAGKQLEMKAAVECTSDIAAGVLRRSLDTLNGMSMLSLSYRNSGSRLPFRLSGASASGSTVVLQGKWNELAQ